MVGCYTRGNISVVVMSDGLAVESVVGLSVGGGIVVLLLAILVVVLCNKQKRLSSKNNSCICYNIIGRN